MGRMGEEWERQRVEDNDMELAEQHYHHILDQAAELVTNSPDSMNDFIKKVFDLMK